MHLRSQGDCDVGRGLSGLHWVWCNGRGRHPVEAGTSGFLSISDSVCRIPAKLGQESQASSCVEEWNSACLLRCSRGDRPLLSCVWNLWVFPDDARGCQCPFMLCLHPQGCLGRGVWTLGPYQERTGKSGSFTMWHHPRGYVSNFLVRPASS